MNRGITYIVAHWAAFQTRSSDALYPYSRTALRRTPNVFFSIGRIFAWVIELGWGRIR